jgi:dipeptidyl aminopeptidase/acylaminoacyl peptidase
MGNPETPEGLALLRDRSPLHKADRIVRPLLIGQGANDPRVKQAESDQIAAAMTERNIPVTYVLFPDEGHGFARPENNIAFDAIAEEFLAAKLGGRCEPAGKTVAASTARFLSRAQ